MIENIFHDDKLLSVIIRAEYKSEGIEFFTPNDFSQQLAKLEIEKYFRKLKKIFIYF